MPEAFAALIVYEPDASAPDNATAMVAAAESVVTGEVTRAVRASKSVAGDVAQDDWIGLVRGDGIVSVAETVQEAATSLLDHIVGPSAELVTIITGTEADGPTTDSIVAWLRDHHGSVTVEVHRGGQPLYPYLFGVE